jgi:hypothetical protein
MLFYNVAPGATQTTNAAPNTANDSLFVAPGAGRAVGIDAIYPSGKGANLTNISGITYRLEKWTTTASSGGTAITPTPKEPGYQAAQATAGFSAGTVTSGTGGPVILLSIGSGTTSPGNWQARTYDEAYRLYGYGAGTAGSTGSMDIFNVAAAASLAYEISLDTFE